MSFSAGYILLFVFKSVYILFLFLDAGDLGFTRGGIILPGLMA